MANFEPEDLFIGFEPGFTNLNFYVFFITFYFDVETRISRNFNNSEREKNLQLQVQFKATLRELL